ncbi:MAG: BrnT family toxin, partial [Desulfobacterales bacterium]|nr:BrnT family toxin [Desulfobacterales bacterium]MBL7181103.1 BrnT family toxin [Desulfobacterales bacterium]
MDINYNFEWDPRKAHDNRDKHGITFDEAATVFRDSKALS